MDLEQIFWQTGPSQAVQMEATTTTTRVLDSNIQAILANMILEESV